jgi:hypothetical protein
MTFIILHRLYHFFANFFSSWKFSIVEHQITFFIIIIDYLFVMIRLICVCYFCFAWLLAICLAILSLTVGSDANFSLYSDFKKMVFFGLIQMLDRKEGSCLFCAWG